MRYIIRANHIYINFMLEKQLVKIFQAALRITAALTLELYRAALISFASIIQYCF